MAEDTTQPQNPTGEVAGQADRGITSNDPTTDTSDQGVSTEQPGVGAETSDSGEEKLIFGKYKTQEEAEKGFKELESLVGRRIEDVVRTNPEKVKELLGGEDLDNVLESAGKTDYEPSFELPFEASEEEKVEAQQVVDFLSQTVGQQVEKTVAPLKRRADLAEIREECAKQNINFDDYLPEVVQTLKQNPELIEVSRKKGDNLLKMAFNYYKASNINEFLKKAEELGKLKAYQTQEQKTAPVGGQTSREVSGGKAFTRAQIAKMSSEEFTKNESEIMKQMSAGLIK